MEIEREFMRHFTHQHHFTHPGRLFLMSLIVLSSLFSIGIFSATPTHAAPVHATSGESHAQLNVSEVLIPSNDEDPPGCDTQIQLDLSQRSYTNYHGHDFDVGVELSAWYYTLADGTLGFCGFIDCIALVTSTNTTPLPSGPIGLSCAQITSATYPYKGFTDGTEQQNGATTPAIEAVGGTLAYAGAIYRPAGVAGALEDSPYVSGPITVLIPLKIV